MLQQYVSPSHKIVDLVAALQVPLANVQAGEEVMIVTDTNMDPLIWQAVMAVCRQRGADPTAMMFSPRPHHTSEPTGAVAAAIKGAQLCVFLTTTALAHTEFSEHRGNVGCLLMEEATVDILTSPGCRATQDDIDLILERERWVRQFWIEGGDVHVTAPGGTDLRAKLAPGDTRSQKPRGILVWDGKKRASGTWPFGECRVTPLEGTGEGRIVWDLCGHAPAGLYGEPVVLTVEKGQVTRIDGGREARAVQQYLEQHGDANSYAAPAEISVGLNHRSLPMGAVRNDKKTLGTAHIAIGRSDIGGTLVSATHFDGLFRQPTIAVNGKFFIKDGVLQL